MLQRQISVSLYLMGGWEFYDTSRGSGPLLHVFTPLINCAAQILQPQFAVLFFRRDGEVEGGGRAWGE